MSLETRHTSTHERAHAHPAPAAERLGRTRSITGLDVAFAAALALLFACHVVAARLALGWVTAAGTDALLVVYLLALAAVPRWRPLVARLLLLGLVAGVFELFTDFSGERVVHSLTYPPLEPMLWASPAYMPISWMIVLAPLAYLAWRLRALVPPVALPWAMFGTGVVAALTVPAFEEFAYYAGWWQYAAAPKWSHTPFYVVLFEGLIGAALPLVVRYVPVRSYGYAAAVGGILGVWMPVAALASWLLLGR